MPLENLRAMLRMFDCAAAAEWRKLEVRQILRESVIPTRQRDTFERGLNSLVSRSVDNLLAMRLSSFGPELLENLEAVLEDHLEDWLDRVPAMHAAPDPVLARITALGLEERLQDSVDRLHAGHLGDRLRRTFGHHTVGALAAIADHEREDRAVREGRRRAREYLQRCIVRAELSDRIAEQHAELMARPVACALESLDAQLAAIVAPTKKPRLRGCHVPGQTRFVEPSLLVYSEPEARDLLTIDLSGESPRIAERISRKSELAPIVPFAIDAARRLLRSPDAKGYQALLEFVSVPKWSRTLGAIDAVLAKNTHETRFAFFVKRTKQALMVSSESIEVDASGRSTVVTRHPMVREHLSDPADARVFRALDRAMYSYQSSVEDRLTALVDHPRVFVDAKPVRVVRERPVLRAREEPGSLRLELTLGSTVLDPSHLVDGNCAVVVDEAAGLLRFAVLTDREHQLLVALSKFGVTLPPDARAELLPRLEQLAAGTEVELEGELAGREVPSEMQLVAQLDARAWPEVSLAIRVRPLEGAAACMPGVGQAQMRTVVAGEPVRCMRDLALERERAEALATSLGFHRDQRDIPLRAVDLAVATLAALKARNDVTIEWLSAPVEVVPFAKRSELRVEIEQRRGWFSIGADVQIDDEHLGLAVLLEAARSGQRFVQLAPGKLVELEADLRARLEALSDHTRRTRDGSLEVAFTAAPAIAALTGNVTAPPSFARVLDRLESSVEPKVPAHLEKVLRPYQREGFEWLARLASWGTGGILADDMGLGKTLQTIALLHARATEGPALVIAPTSVVGNWLAELGRFGEGLRAIDYRTAGRGAVLRKLRAGDVVVASFDLVARDVKAFEGTTFGTMIVDEAQATKNANTQRARALRTIRRDVCFALTGTPIENHLGELWSIATLACPGLLGSWESFRERFAAPIEAKGDPQARAALARLVRPFLLRRTKENVTPELPQLTEITREVVLGTRERATYEAARRTALARMAGLSDDARGRVSALAELMRLRRLACHPQLVAPDSEVPSAKLESALELIDGIIQGGHRALIFSQFVDHLAVVRHELEARGIEYLYLDGSTKPAERPARVAEFQSGKAPLFLISLRAGGTGLNLTAADYVLHLDPWWNPAVEDQATDRAHRIGQNKPVTVVRLVAMQTIEEGVVSLHRSKRALADSLLEGADTAARLSMRELVDLVRGTELVEPVAPECVA